MIKICETCGCVYDNETESPCPLCKLRSDIPDMLEDLYNRIKECGMWSPDY